MAIHDIGRENINLLQHLGGEFANARRDKEARGTESEINLDLSWKLLFASMFVKTRNADLSAADLQRRHRGGNLLIDRSQPQLLL